MLPVDRLDTLSHSPLAEGGGREDDTNRTRRGRPTTLITDAKAKDEPGCWSHAEAGGGGCIGGVSFAADPARRHRVEPR
jgi:hypothetical protein